MKLSVFVSAAVLTLLGCGSPDGPADAGTDAGPPLFPADYAETYTELRNCRSSGDHNLNRIRILVSPDGVNAYTSREVDFPPGAIVIKEEHDFADEDCTGPVTLWTVMKRLPTGESPQTLDWEWQSVDADSTVLDVNTQGCVNCHTGCGSPPDGHDGTCALP